MEQTRTTPPDEHEVVIHVKKGTAREVEMAQAQADALPNEITVRISKKRRTPAMRLLGVVVN